MAIQEAIEQKRESLYFLAKHYELSSPLIIQLSQELDELLNHYQRELTTT